MFSSGKSKDIELKQDISGYLVFPYIIKKNKVFLNQKAVVPENTLLVFSIREKILDILASGEYNLSAMILPKCSKKFNLQKVDKKGKLPDKFSCFVYYINLKEVQNLQFSTYHKLKYKNEIDGNFGINIIFDICLKIGNYEILMKNLFAEFSYLKLGESEEIISDWTSEYVTDLLQKEQHRKSDFEERIQDIEELLAIKISKFLTEKGLELTNFQIVDKFISKDKNKNDKGKKLTIQNYPQTQNENSYQQNTVDNEKMANNKEKEGKTSQAINKQSTSTQNWQGWENRLK